MSESGKLRQTRQSVRYGGVTFGRARGGDWGLFGEGSWAGRQVRMVTYGVRGGVGVRGGLVTWPGTRRVLAGTRDWEGRKVYRTRQEGCLLRSRMLSAANMARHIRPVWGSQSVERCTSNEGDWPERERYYVVIKSLVFGVAIVVGYSTDWR